MLGCTRRRITGPPRDCGEPVREERSTPELLVGLCLNFIKSFLPLTIGNGCGLARRHWAHFAVLVDPERGGDRHFPGWV